jgi:Ca-activated chloride channel homolog
VSFEHPLLLLTALVVAAATGVFLLLLRRRPRYAVRFTNVDVLAQVVEDRRSWRRYLPPTLFLLALASLSVAVARPHVKVLAPIERATVVLVIDTSRSMLSDDVQPSRLAAAQAAAQTFLDRVPKRLRVGVVAFSGEAQVLAPPTADRSLVRTSIEAIGPFAGYGGTAIGDAIARAVELGQQAVRRDAQLSAAGPSTPTTARGFVSILFLSDGRQNRGVLTPLQGAARARDAGIPVHTVALGRAGGGSGSFGGSRNRTPDPETLRAIARATGGAFFEARTAKSLQAAYAGLGSRLGRAPKTREVTYAFVAGAAALVVLAVLLSARWAARLP